MGIAFISIKGKETFLNDLTVLSAALGRVAYFIAYLTPVGIFAIAANAAGTMALEDLGPLQIYLVTLGIAGLLITFWILPMLAAICTPFKYKDIVRVSRDALIIAFTTGNLFVVLPMVIKNCKDLLEQYGMQDEETDSLTNILIPVFFNLPNMGKLLMLFFILFAGWYSGNALSASKYGAFVPLGLCSFFGHTITAIPFLLDYFHIPIDLFQLHLVVSVFVFYFTTLTGAMNLTVFNLMGISAIKGSFVIRLRNIVLYGIGTVAFTIVIMIGVRFFYSHILDLGYTKYLKFVDMGLLYDPAPAKVYRETLPAPVEKQGLEAINERGFLRVGYFRDSLPYAFVNASGNLVGFDIEMAHALARDLGVSLEFVLIERADFVECLNQGVCDIVMSGMVITPSRAMQVLFAKTYMDNTLAFVVQDYRRDDFNSSAAIEKLDNPRIGVPDVPEFIAMIKAYLPSATIVPIKNPRELLRGNLADLDALAYTAEAGSAWTLVYPQFTVAVPKPDIISIPLAYPVARSNKDFAAFVSTWVGLKQKDGTMEKTFDHWILGKGSEKKEPRWSVIRDVLGWVE